ncbi:ATP-binding cassette domain-containing protein [Streptomyces californicus]|uniref:Mom family adenine methylcarbamoylation protein n=1 Tax=Streptomyces californicus TaxID=67351 RepID=UPI00379BA857
MTGPVVPSPADRRLMRSGDCRGFTQRWRYGTPTWRHVSEGGFRADRYEVVKIGEADAKAFVHRHHYLSGWPAVLHRLGLLDREASLQDGDIAVDGSPLVGVLVLAVPMNMRVLTNPFPHLVPLRESAEIARLVLTESVPSNGESFFTSAALRHVAAEGLRGAVMFSDPVPRRRITENGHIIQTQVSARENITLGQGDGDDETVMAAARASGADDVIACLADGLDTNLAPSQWGGRDLSGGQWQRLAGARAFHRKDAPVLICDEPTSALDPRAEEAVYDRIRALSEGRSVILITHRLGSTRAADRIIVLDGGRLLEEGTHDSLLAADGEYAALWRTQARTYADQRQG